VKWFQKIGPPKPLLYNTHTVSRNYQQQNLLLPILLRLPIFHLLDTPLKYIQNLRRQEEPVLIEQLSKLISLVSLFSSAWTGATGDILSVSHAYLSLFPIASVLDAPSVAAGIGFNYSTFAGYSTIRRRRSEGSDTGSLFLHRQWQPSPAKPMSGGAFLLRKTSSKMAQKKPTDTVHSLFSHYPYFLLA
jgi:hypothetical protein